MSSTPIVRFLDRATPPHISTLILMAGMSALVMNIFVPSLNAMADWFEADYGLIQLSVSGYLLMNAILQIFIGPMSDKMGRRPIIIWGTVIFLLATLGCLISTNIYVFLLFRMVQSTIVVAMVLSRAVVRDLFPADEAASRIGYVTMGMSVVPMVAPVMGGALAEAFGWQSNFWVMFGFGAAMLWLVWQDLGETATKSGLTLGQQFREYPELLTSPRFWGYALACAFSSGAFFSYVGGASFVGSEVFDLNPTQLGLYFGAPALGYFAGNGISGKYSARVGINKMILWGGFIIFVGMALSMLLFALNMGSALSFFGFMTFVGFGNGLTIPNATSGALSVRPRLAGTASGLAGAIMLLGGAAMSSLAGALLSPETGAWPLLWLMMLSAVTSIMAILMVIRREKRIAGLDLA